MELHELFNARLSKAQSLGWTCEQMGNWWYATNPENDLAGIGDTEGSAWWDLLTDAEITHYLVERLGV